MITINGQEFSEEQVRAMFELCSELMKINEDQNAKLIAFDAKLKNEEKKSKEYQMKLWLCQQHTINEYKG